MILLAAAVLAGCGPEDEPLRKDVEAESRLDIRMRFWLAHEGNTRIRSMEQEALAKGGTGRGTLFQYEDVEVEGYTPIPELEARYVFGPHEVWGRMSTARRSEHIQLHAGLEFDGDLHVPGESMQVRFEMTLIEAGYTYRVKAGDLEIRIGAEIAYWNWQASFESFSGGETSDEVIPTVLAPVPTASLRWTLAEGIAWRSEATMMYGLDLRRGLTFGQNGQGILRLTSELEVSLGPVALLLGVGYSVQDSVSFEHRDEADLLNYRRAGASLGLEIRF